MLVRWFFRVSPEPSLPTLSAALLQLMGTSSPPMPFARFEFHPPARSEFFRNLAAECLSPQPFLPTLPEKFLSSLPILHRANRLRHRLLLPAFHPPHPQPFLAATPFPSYQRLPFVPPSSLLVLEKELLLEQLDTRTSRCLWLRTCLRTILFPPNSPSFSSSNSPAAPFPSFPLHVPISKGLVPCSALPLSALSPPFSH